MSNATLVTPRGEFAPGNLEFHVAEAIRWLSRREELDRAHVAHSAGVDPEELSRYMTGVESFPVVACMAIAEVFKLRTETLIGLAQALMEGRDPGEVLERD